MVQLDERTIQVVPPEGKGQFRKHGVSFAEGTSVFANSLAVVTDDPLHSLEEDREIILGHSSRHRLLLICFVERKGSIRLISARPATRREQRDYEEGKIS